MRHGAQAVAQIGVEPAGIERVAAEADGQDLERDVHLEIGALHLPALLHQIEQLGRRLGDRAPGLGEIGLLQWIAGRPGREQGAPQAQRQRSGAALERVDRGGAVPERALSQHDAPGLGEGGGERVGEACGARVGLFVVVLRRHAHQVLETELESRGSRSAPSTGSVTAITSSQRRHSSSE